MIATTDTKTYSLQQDAKQPGMNAVSDPGSPDDESATTDDAPKGNFLWSRKKLFAVLLSAMASSLAWAVQVGYSTPTLLHLGMHPDTVGLAWLAGPLSGIIVQPLIGILSDNCQSKFGRRRPFILGAALSTALSLILFSQTERIGRALLGENELQIKFSLSLAIFIFCMMDCSINAMMAPTRALIADLVPTSQQSEATAYVSIHDGLGKATGYLIGSINLEKLLPRLGGELQIVFMGAAILIVVFCLITVCLANDDRKYEGGYSGQHHSSGPNFIRAVCTSFAVIPRLPKAVRRAFFIQFCNSFAWFSFMVYGTDYFGQHINKGLPWAVTGSVDRMNYDEGVRIGNFALFFLSITSAGFAHCLAALIRRFSLISVFVVAELHLMLTLLIMPFISTNQSAILLYSVLGLTFAATNTIPWMIVTREISRMPEAGVFSATFNLSQCLPQIIASLLSGPILLKYNGSVASIFVMGAVGAGLASCMILALVEEHPNEYEQLDEGQTSNVSVVVRSH